MLLAWLINDYINYVKKDDFKIHYIFLLAKFYIHKSKGKQWKYFICKYICKSFKINYLNYCSFLTVSDSALFICIFPLVILVYEY